MPSKIFVGMEVLHMGAEGNKVQHRKIKRVHQKWKGWVEIFSNFLAKYCSLLDHQPYFNCIIYP